MSREETVRLDGDQPLPLGHVMANVREYSTGESSYVRLGCEICGISALISSPNEADVRSLVDIVRSAHEAATTPGESE